MALKLATINLYQFAEPPVAWYNPDNKYSDDQWTEKTQWIKDQLAAIEADIIGFQEVFSIDALKQLCADSGYSQFAVVDAPEVVDAVQHVFRSPVVAIASKFPISSVQGLAIEATLLDEVPVSNNFKYSRIPLRAEIQHPSVGKILVYVMHLKSKRPIIKDDNINAGDSWTVKAFKAAKANSFGKIAALVQRGVEASMVYHYAMKDIENASEVPLIILGDMNADEDSVVIDALSNQAGRFRIEDLSPSQWPIEAKIARHNTKLFDAFFLAPNQNGGKRPPTHYFNKEGATLDYIFVSNVCNERNPNHVLRPLKFKVINEHLHQDGVGNDKQSDHALVLLELQLK